MANLISAYHIVLLALGFGFVIFFHELGHFLAAKWQKVKVEQFAVGFGPAIFAWRKGIGFRQGTTTPEFERRIKAHIETRQTVEAHEDAPLSAAQIDKAMADLGLSETEYRLNWIPLGGYVKMLGQDDLRPGAVAEDPRAYNNKSIGGRMIIVSAGVVMNVILAAVGFMIVFLMGFHVAPAEVGGVLSDSPAAKAVTADGKPRPLVVGDRLLEIDGDKEQDFTKVAQSVALSEEGKSLPIKVQHRDGSIETLYVTPEHPDAAGKGLLAIGVMPPSELRGPDADEYDAADLQRTADCFSPVILEVKPGDVITAINGQPVAPSDKDDEYWKLDHALASSDGQNIPITIQSADGKTRQISILPQFQTMFGEDQDMQFAGMAPRVQVNEIQEHSNARGQVKPGDVIEAVTTDRPGGDTSPDPSFSTLTTILNANGQQDQKIRLSVRGPDDAAPRETAPMLPDQDVGRDRKGLGVGLTTEQNDTIVASVVHDSPAFKAGIQPRWRITSVDGHAVSNWFQVRHWLLNAAPNKPIPITAMADGQLQHVAMDLTPEASESLADMTFTTDINSVLSPRIVIRKTSNPLVAAQWGVIETRDFILQFYLTIKRMFQGSVSAGNAMGPVGIFASGAKIASRGTDWLIWFLSVISANLAVVNFLPIPVVDGGLFTFLVLEKIQGKPLSQEAQKIVQMVGLALILGVFLLVTYQDIVRLFGRA